MDTPGTLWGKFEDQKVAHHLAYIGSIREDILDVSELCFDFIDEMKKIYPDALKNRYNLGELRDDTLQIFEQIAMARGFKLKGNQPDYERTAKMVIDDFRKGKLGKIMLENPRKLRFPKTDFLQSTGINSLFTALECRNINTNTYVKDENYGRPQRFDDV